MIVLPFRPVLRGDIALKFNLASRCPIDCSSLQRRRCPGAVSKRILKIEFECNFAGWRYKQLSQTAPNTQYLFFENDFRLFSPFGHDCANDLPVGTPYCSSSIPVHRPHSLSITSSSLLVKHPEQSLRTPSRFGAP